jgi:flavin-dependent dehydrogenase
MRTASNVDVVVLGSSIAGLMTAAWLAHVQPTLSIVVIGPEVGVEKRPIVGESLVEPAILFFLALGLGPYLETRHELKNGLAFYHKLAPNDPDDRRYTVHMPMARLHHRARQLHRPAFDIELGRKAAQLGVELVQGTVTDIELGTGGAHHVVHVGDRRFTAPFVVDATGRRRLLGRQVTHYEQPAAQRSAFWFRLADFEPLLPRLELSWRRPAEYDLWQSTHHFMGKGNWIWGIPLRDDDGQPLLSMGITWRPDVFGEDVRTLEEFLARVDAEHPAISEIVRSGRVLDTNLYRNYLYRAERVYSEDGWFLVGDAARSVDPLYSTGLSMTVVQIEQIAEIIRRRRRGAGMDAAQIDELQGLWRVIADLRQGDISDQYLTMNDPFQACMRRYWNLCAWFNGVLPLWYCGYFQDPDAARTLRRLFANSAPSNQAAWRLFGQIARELGEVDQTDFDRMVDFDWLINRRFDRPPEQVGPQLSTMMWKRARVRANLLAMGRWRQLPNQAPYLLRELALAGALRIVWPRLPALRGVRARRGLPGASAMS